MGRDRYFQLRADEGIRDALKVTPVGDAHIRRHVAGEEEPHPQRADSGIKDVSIVLLTNRVLIHHTSQPYLFSIHH